MKIFLVCLLSLFAVPALAQQITIKSSCQPVAVETAGAEYVPGIDVHGEPVAPAEIESTVGAIAYPLVLPVELHDLKTLELDIDADLGTDVAFVTLFEDGHIEYNGQDISDRMQFACADAPDDDDPVIVYKEQEGDSRPESSQPGGQLHTDDVPSGAVEQEKSVTEE